MKKITMNRPLASCLCFFLLFPVWLYAEQEPAYTVGVLYWSMNIAGQVAMRQGLEREAQRINEQAKQQGLRAVRLLPFVAGDGDEGIERQIGQMLDLVMQGVDLIIVQPTDNAALAKPLQAANRAGIPVVAYDQYISAGQLAAYLTSDNYQAGYLDGEFTANAFSTLKEISIIVVEYPHVSSTVERVNGFLDALGEHSQPYKILKTYEAVEPVAGRKVGRAIVAGFPQRGSVDVVFTVNDGGGLSVVDELAKAGRYEIFVATIDGDPASVDNIRRGRLTRIDAAQFCGPLGAESMKTAYALLQGKPVAKHVQVPTFPITLGTLSRYPGWQGPIPRSFRKSWRSLHPDWKNTLVEK